MLIPGRKLPLSFVSIRVPAFWRCAILCAIAFAVATAPRSAWAQCKPAPPSITAVAHQPNATSVTVQWSYKSDTFVHCPDFYQVRWTKGDGPQTQSQSPRLDSGSSSWVVNGIDPNAVYGFIVQACSNSILSAANCTVWSAMAFYKPYGPATCRIGYVWRGAFSGDQVCVTPQTRQATAADNIASRGRTKADGTCMSGFVWRAARPSDLVCVTPATRGQAAADNAQASGRVLPPP
jgi:hypothetical protein